MKSLDKKKPKELDWEKTFYDNFCSIERNPYSNETFYIVDRNERNPEKYLRFIQSLLTQQRIELLEEIKTRIDTWGGFEDGGGNLCHYDSEILEWVNNLLNKKDE